MTSSDKQLDSQDISVVIATRIFTPEPAAASFRLQAVAEALMDRGNSVTVLTSTYKDAPAVTPLQMDEPIDAASRGSSRVLRWPVHRDKTGYLRGYLPYMSFDLPLALRLLACKRPNVVLAEPPPTTGFIVRLICAIRKIPYVWYAADIWSDATQISGAPKPVVSVVRAIEKFVLKGAAGVIAVTGGVAERVTELGAKNVVVVPNGIDTKVYGDSVEPLAESELQNLGIVGPYVIYAGTASEWQGAEVFAQALQQLSEDESELQLVYVGSGTSWPHIKQIAEESTSKLENTRIVTLSSTTPERVARLLNGASAALVSVTPGVGYDFAYPTKVLAALAAGVPVLFAGLGPAAQDIEENELGVVCHHDPKSVAEAMCTIISADHAKGLNPVRLRRWVKDNRSLESTGRKAADFIISQAR